MIAKKVKNPQKSASKTARISHLTAYIREPERENSQEKCVYAGARGFITDNPQSQTAEMIALSQEAVKSKDTINHYVLSWREGEQPSLTQVEEAVDIFMNELGVTGHQVTYGLHADTDNLHLHQAINRVHPDTLKVVKINKGFDIEAAHKSIARIEHAQGWQREQNARYQVLENGDLGREHIDADKPRQPSQPKCDMENRTGEKSAERIAIEDGAPIIKRAQTWAHLHRELAAAGMRYEEAGSGAIIFVGDVGVKASSADRSASLSKMQKRLGVYQPAPEHQPIVPRAPEPIKPDVPGWRDYITGRHAHHAERAATKLAQDTRLERERKALQERHTARRDELMGGDWRGLGPELNALRSVIAAEQAAEKAVLKELQQKEREQHRQRFRPYPDLEQWQRTKQSPELAEQWRHRASEPQRTEGEGDEVPSPRDIRAYQAEIHGQQVRYTRKSEDEDGGGAGGRDVSFVDMGKRIDIHNWPDHDATLAALQLSAQKWGSFTVTGNDEYKTMCVKLAAEHGFRISNPELQERIEQERQRLHQERAQAMTQELEPFKQFKRYADAVGADRYRVTSIRMKPDGGKIAFVLGKSDGFLQGFTCQEMEQRMPEMVRLQRRGESVCSTPLSENRHHILIDDMDREKLDRLISEGYQPAILLESSPGSYQAIITVPKLGTAHDKDVGNRLSDTLNREYGDPKLSGAVHPHRAPGYENRKPEHQREDGGYPEVRLLKAERCECTKTLALSHQIDAEYQQLAALKAQQPGRKAKLALEASGIAVASGIGINVYQRHYRDVLKHQQGGAVDLSRVDSMIALRMRVTGHDQAAIEDAIRQYAPVARQQDEGRNWDDYAQRTARYAFSASSDRQTADLDKYRRQWENLEGRPVQMKESKSVTERDRSPGMGR